MYSFFRDLSIGLFLVCNCFLVGCQKENTDKFEDSRKSNPKSSGDQTVFQKESPNHIKELSSKDGVQLIEWAELANAEGETVANVLTFRMPMPAGLRWNTEGYHEPARGDISSSQKWARSNVTAQFAEKQVRSFGRAGVHAPNQSSKEMKLLGAPFSHFDATFVLLADIVGQKFIVGEHVFELTQERLKRVHTKLRCSYEIFSNPNSASEQATVLVRTSRQVRVEKVKIGNFVSEVHSNGSNVVFHGDIHRSASSKEQTLLIKLAEFDDWIPFEFQLPFVSGPANKNKK